MVLSKKKLDNYFKRARVVSELSKDPDTKVGCLLINENTGIVAMSGYNSYVRNVDDCEMPKCRPEKYKYIMHAEQNALLNSARRGVSTEGLIAVCTLSPCILCCRSLYQAGISTVYFDDKYRDFDTQLNMKDLNIETSSYFGYTKLLISPKKSRKDKYFFSDPNGTSCI